MCVCVCDGWWRALSSEMALGILIVFIAEEEASQSSQGTHMLQRLSAVASRPSQCVSVWACVCVPVCVFSTSSPPPLVLLQQPLHFFSLLLLYTAVFFVIFLCVKFSSCNISGDEFEHRLSSFFADQQHGLSLHSHYKGKRHNVNGRSTPESIRGWHGQRWLWKNEACSEAGGKKLCVGYFRIFVCACIYLSPLTVFSAPCSFVLWCRVKDIIFHCFRFQHIL